MPSPISIPDALLGLSEALRAEDQAVTALAAQIGAERDSAALIDNTPTIAPGPPAEPLAG